GICPRPRSDHGAGARQPRRTPAQRLIPRSTLDDVRISFQFRAMDESLTHKLRTPPLTGPAGLRSLAVARGIGRLFARNDIWMIPEMPLRNGRRADLMGVDPKGRIVIVEIKCARGDLM